MGIGSFFKKVGKKVKKVVKKVGPYALPVAAAALPFIPGVSAAASSLVGGIKNFFGGSSAQSNADFVGPPEPPRQDKVEITGAKQQPDYFGLLADAAPGFMSYLGQKQTNEANSAQAQRQMDFQAEQTGTSYQRGIADMKAAGLNPMLAYSQGGAASGGGAQAQIGNDVGAGVNTAMAAAMQKNQIAQLQAQVDNTRADTSNKDTSNALIEAQTDESRARRTTELLRPGVLTAEERKLVLGNMLSEATLQANIRSGHSAADFASDHARREKALANIDERGLAKADAYSSWYKSATGKTEPDMHYWTTIANSAGNVAGKLNPFKLGRR